MNLLSQVLFDIFIVVGLVNLIHMGLYMTGANFYDMWQYYRQSKSKHLKSPHKTRPLITVLIPAYNEERAIVRCLDSVRTNTYRKLQIIVIDDRSTDQTRQLVRDYIRQHPKRSITLLARRKNRGKAAGLNAALRNHTKGTHVMTLDADSVLERHAINRAVSYFKNENIVGVAANVRVMDNSTVLGILQKFEHMIGYRSKKFYSLTNAEFIVGGVASTYRYSVLKQVRFYDNDTATEDIGLSVKVVSLGNRNHRIIYAADVVAMTEGVQTFTALLQQRYRWKLGSLQNLIKYWRIVGEVDVAYNRMLTLYRLPMAFLSEVILILEPFILGYAIYLSIIYKTFGLFFGAYLTITAYVLWTIWPDEHSLWRRKIVASLYAPFMYFIFFIMDGVQIISIIRCLIHGQQLFSRSSKSSTWTSPERRGGEMQIT